jgi:hypothetical protein
MNYTESKQKLDAIRSKYMCAGDIIFRTAIQAVVEQGQYAFRDEVWCKDLFNKIDVRHDAAEAEGKILFMTRDFEKAIFECAKEIAGIEAYDLLMYIQKEIYLGGNGIDYKRAIELLRGCLDYCGNNTYEIMYTLEMAEEMGFTEDEIEELGYGYMLGEEEEEE